MERERDRKRERPREERTYTHQEYSSLIVFKTRLPRLYSLVVFFVFQFEPLQKIIQKHKKHNKGMFSHCCKLYGYVRRIFAGKKQYESCLTVITRLGFYFSLKEVVGEMVLSLKCMSQKFFLEKKNPSVHIYIIYMHISTENRSSIRTLEIYFLNLNQNQFSPCQGC